MQSKNVRKATAAGVVGGAATSPLAVWLATIASGKWGIPLEVAALIVAPAFSFFTGWLSRWAAKLNPRD